jgi:hypothetical protein
MNEGRDVPALTTVAHELDHRSQSRAPGAVDRIRRGRDV